MALRLALLVGVSAAALGLLYERTSGIGRSVFCNAISGLSSPHLMILGFFAYLGLSLVALVASSIPSLAAAAGKVSREFALLEIQWCSATAGLLCGIVGFTSRTVPWWGLMMTAIAVSGAMLLAAFTWYWAEIIRDAVEDFQLPRVVRIRRAVLALILLYLFWGPFVGMQDWSPLREGVPDCSPSKDVGQ
ncbi:hypothetical protein C1931_17690 [Stenotrophomonas sp. YAU14A_MKIMI4_1]|nr:hypothetical protein C1931_17690 [Stenotrophomonas sp. YAU14A_MKIMI4_1]